MEWGNGIYEVYFAKVTEIGYTIFSSKIKKQKNVTVVGGTRKQEGVIVLTIPLS